MTPNDLDMFKVKNTNMHKHKPQRPGFHPFHSTPSLFRVSPLFGNVYRIIPNDLDMYKVKITNMHAAYTPRGPNFCPFHSTKSHFQVTAQFCKKLTEWQQNKLDIFKVKGTYMHTRYIPEVQIFIRFALQCAILKQIAIFEFHIGYNVKIKLVTPNELKMSQFQKEHFMGTTIRSLYW